jgi:hypothetical protein
MSIAPYGLPIPLMVMVALIVFFAQHATID